MKAEMPATIPAIIVSAKAGLVAISATIVLPDETDLYNVFVNDVPIINNNGITTINPTDHLPNLVIGIILQGFLFILSSYRRKEGKMFPYFHLILPQFIDDGIVLWKVAQDKRDKPDRAFLNQVG